MGEQRCLELPGWFPSSSTLLFRQMWICDKGAFVHFEYFLLVASFSLVNCLQASLRSIGKVWWLHRRWVVRGQREWCSPPKLSQILQQLHKGKHYFQITSLPDISTNTLLQWPQLAGNHFYTSSMGEKSRDGRGGHPGGGGGRGGNTRASAGGETPNPPSLHLHSTHPHSTVETLPSYYWVGRISPASHRRLCHYPKTRSAKPARGRQWWR